MMSLSLIIEFWHQMLEALKDAGVQRYLNVSPLDQNWLYARCGLSSVHYGIIFTRNEARVEFGIARESKEQNKALHDLLHKQIGAINAAFGEELNWRRLDEKKASLIDFSHPFDGHNREKWPEMIQWIVSHMIRIEKHSIPTYRR